MLTFVEMAMKIRKGDRAAVRTHTFFVGEQQVLVHNFCASGGGDELNIYRGKTSAPQWPEDFTPARGQTERVPVKDRDPLNQLRSQLPGKWQKVYEHGWIDGQQVEMHYFQHESGAVLDVKVVPGW